MSQFLLALLFSIVGLNIFLALLNLIPVPPLDGSKILTLILPHEYAMRMQAMGMGAIVLALLAFFILASPIGILAQYLASLIIGI